jgi:hypothetical protein
VSPQQNLATANRTASLYAIKATHAPSHAVEAKQRI